MAKLVEYDVTGVEDSQGGGSEQPRPAVYPAMIRVCEQRDTRADGTPANDLRIALDLGGDYAWVWTYIGLGEASEWKLKEFTNALGLKPKGKFDPDKLVSKMVRVKINPDTYEGEYRARAGRLMKAVKGDTLPEAGEDGAEPEDLSEEEDQELTAEASADDEEFTPSREGEDFGNYDDWSDEDLEAEVQDRGVTVKGGRGKKKDKWVQALRDDDSAAAAEPGDDDFGEEEEESADDYDTWSVDELTAEFKDREIELPKKPRGQRAAERYTEALVKGLRDDDEENPFEDE
jgi:hypothetical protein